MTQMPTPFKAKPTPTAHVPITLRTLRLWHYRKAKAAGQRLAYYKQFGPRYKIDQRKQRETHEFHSKCVAALNEVVSGLVEMDDEANG